MKKYLALFVFIALLQACSQKDLSEEAQSIKREYEEYIPQVDTFLLKRSGFEVELVSNGKLQAFNKSTLYFESEGWVNHLPIKDGVRVNQGQVIAQLEDSDDQLTLERTKIELSKARINLFDKLLNYAPSGTELDTANVPPQVLENIYFTSGYRNAELAHREALRAIDKNKLAAPFSGRIANLEKKKYDRVSAGSPLCLLIDDSEFEVIFHVIEAEVSMLAEGQKILVNPFSFEEEYEGVISSINPFVDENGLIEVRALVQNKDDRLLEGLNVRIKSQQMIANQLVVPKEAVLPRDGRKVVFTYSPQKQIAEWNYVEVVFENTTSYAIKSGQNLVEGEFVIFQGNINLAHESRVEFVKGP